MWCSLTNSTGTRPCNNSIPTLNNIYVVFRFNIHRTTVNKELALSIMCATKYGDFVCFKWGCWNGRVWSLWKHVLPKVCVIKLVWRNLEVSKHRYEFLFRLPSNITLQLMWFCLLHLIWHHRACYTCGDGLCEGCNDYDEFLIDICTNCKRALCYSCFKMTCCGNCKYECYRKMCNDCHPQDWECMRVTSMILILLVITKKGDKHAQIATY